MNLQYITDSNGLTTGVFIPIQEWNNLKSKLGDIDQANTDIPDWHREIVRKRMELYKNGTDQAMDFDTAINDIENEL